MCYITFREDVIISRKNWSHQKNHV